MLGGLTIYLPVANFLQCICAKNYENWLTVDKVIVKKILVPLCIYFYYYYYYYFNIYVCCVVAVMLVYV